MRRRHAMSPVFSGYSQDPGISSLNMYASACTLILSVVIDVLLRSTLKCVAGQVPAYCRFVPQNVFQTRTKTNIRVICATRIIRTCACGNEFRYLPGLVWDYLMRKQTRKYEQLFRRVPRHNMDVSTAHACDILAGIMLP